MPDAPDVVAVAATLLEVTGVAVIVLGALLAALRLVLRPAQGLYRSYRQDLGRALLLGLEFLVGADIIRTVSAEPTLRGVLVLGLIVLVRTFLSFVLEMELEGTWPWRRHARSEVADAAAGPARGPSPTEPAPQGA